MGAAAFHFGLIAATLLVGVDFVIDLVHLFVQPRGEDQVETILSLFEKSMVATLLITSALGTYQIFVRPIRADLGWLLPWLDHITAKDLKIVMSLSLAGVTSIGLLKDFHEKVSWSDLLQHLAIHFTFILSALAIALIAKWMHTDTH